MKNKINSVLVNSGLDLQTIGFCIYLKFISDKKNECHESLQQMANFMNLDVKTVKKIKKLLSCTNIYKTEVKFIDIDGNKYDESGSRLPDTIILNF